MSSLVPSPRVQRKRAERRERIVEAAFQAIAEDGPADFSLNKLARDLDYTPGALYWYFPSKEALVVEVQCVAFSELTTIINRERAAWEQQPALATQDLPCRRLHSLLALARFYLDLGRTEPRYFRLIAFSIDPRVWLDDDSAERLAPVLAEVFLAVAAPFIAAQEDGVLSPGDGAGRAVQYWTALQGLLQTGKLARIAPELFDVPRLGADSARALLLGWGADPDALERARALLD
ncbi:MAG: TetR/AcrR family transcriptional regulator [Myxococcales bacterium]|nr:TetR/AcrR family transcriptional regulator [Myxococcales bacterium]